MIRDKVQSLAQLAAFLGFQMLLATSAFAQRLGPELQVNTYSTALQIESAVGADSAGNFVIVWRSGQDGSGWGTFGQRYDSTGAPAGTEFRVNGETLQTQWQPKVAMLGSGAFVATWSLLDQDVLGRRFDGGGVPIGNDFLVNSHTTFQQYNPALAATGDGSFVVAWNSYGQDGMNLGVFGQRFNATGLPEGSEFQVNTYTTASQVFPSVSILGSTGFVVVWSGGSQDGSGYGVFGQRFTATGTPAGAEFQVNTYTTGSQAEAVVASNGSGEFLVVWSSDGQDGDGLGVFGQRFEADGTPAGAEFRVNTHAPGLQSRPAIAAGADGDFLVVWQAENADGFALGVVGQRFSSEGVRRGGEFQINTYTTGVQHESAVAAAGSGEFVVSWTSYDHQDGSYRGVFAQRIAPPLFADGFEAADACEWSATSGGGCP